MPWSYLFVYGQQSLNKQQNTVQAIQGHDQFFAETVSAMYS